MSRNVMHGAWCLALVVGGLLALGCGEGEADYDRLWEQSISRVSTKTTETAGVSGEIAKHQRSHFMDSHGRYIHLRGINTSGSHKSPPSEEFPSLYPLAEAGLVPEECVGQVPVPAECIPAKVVDYIGRPFPEGEEEKWFGQLAELGFNSVRLILNWESIQPFRPGTCDTTSGRYTEECYDLEFLDYYESLVAMASDFGIYVLADMHQDIFSRHLMSYFSETPQYPDPANPDEIKVPEEGTLDHFVLSLFPPYTDWVRGHGAPRWIVETCLPEKDMDAPSWGLFRGLGHLRSPNGIFDLELLVHLNNILDRVSPGEIPEWLPHVVEIAPERFEPNETSDLLPVTPWLLDGGLSLDVDRCFAALFAGDVAFPELMVDGDGYTREIEDLKDPENAVDLKTYLQDKYVDAWLQVAERTAKYDNVIGYDIMNEPVGIFLMMTVAGAFSDLTEPPPVCEFPVDCALAPECRPDAELLLAADVDCELDPNCAMPELGAFPDCFPTDLLEEGQTVEEAYEALKKEAGLKWECLDRKGRSSFEPDAEGEKWCRRTRLEVSNVSAVYQEALPIENMLVGLLGEGLGADIFAAVKGLQLIPTDAHPYTLWQWGMLHLDPGVALDLNFNFDAKYLQPLYEKVGKAIQEVDEHAIIWFESATSLRTVTGPSPFFDAPMTRPQGIKQAVYAPHWYPDIYPMPGLDSGPREFNEDEWLYRDFKKPLKKYLDEAPAWLGNVPVVFGEFGTYFNFGGHEASKENDYLVSRHVLNSYYEAFESLGVGNMVWCFSAENDAQYGELWNKEDFSIIGPDGEPRGRSAYVRPYARALSGKPIKQFFYSEHHFYDPVAGEKIPTRRFGLEMERSETSAPTEVFVPAYQYSDGFEVWVSDGDVFYDWERQILYWYPTVATQGAHHSLRIDPYFADRETRGWTARYRDGSVTKQSGFGEVL